MDLDLFAKGGVFSAREALQAGIDGRALTSLCHRHICTRLTHGWYAVGVPGDVRERHRLTAVALARAYAGAALVSHSSALVLLGLPLQNVDLGTVHLTRLRAPEGGEPKPWSGQSRWRPGLLLHRAQAQPAVGGEAAGPAGTTVTVAHAVVGAGLVGAPSSALVAADAALSRRLLQPADLTRAVAEFEGHRGIGPVRAALVHADPRHESPGESLTAHLLRRLGYALQPQFQVLAEGRTYRADFRIAGTSVLVEFDGRVKYSSGDANLLYDEKRREDVLRRAGWLVVRLIWADLASPELVDARIRRALQMAAA